MKNIKKFIDNIEDIYNNISILRAIVIVKTMKDVYVITNLLKNYDHCPKFIDSPILNDKYRLFITTIDYINVVRLIEKKNYNLIISYKNVFI
jgi:hypothetical protein